VRPSSKVDWSAVFLFEHESRILQVIPLVGQCGGLFDNKSTAFFRNVGSRPLIGKRSHPGTLDVRRQCRAVRINTEWRISDKYFLSKRDVSNRFAQI
jgi:hypothetical protein